MRDLSILIPAYYKEPFTRETVEDVLRNLRADTDVIVVSDGGWPDKPIVQHPRVQLIRYPMPVGQRGAVNLAAKLSDAKYVMKLDAHCAVSEGFDVALIDAAQTLGEDVTQIPLQYNLHVFNWRCEACGATRYQGPRPMVCGEADRSWDGPTCGRPGPFERVMVWDAKRRPTTTWAFDSSLVFEQFGDFQHRTSANTPFPETMSCLGACWFLSRERFWQLGGLDEGHGSWGQMGTEIACKSWLSGGRMVTNPRAYFSHMFRPSTGPDWGFPFPMSGGDADVARDYSRKLWLNNAWSGQVRPLKWLVEHFWPVPNWTEAAKDALPELRREVAA